MTNKTDIDINDVSLLPGSHMHFIGIGGSSMSGIAEIALHRGYRVTGSDRADSEALNKLRRLGARITVGHRRENIKKDCALVVYTLAISDDNPEYIEAKRLGIPTIERGKFLGALCREYTDVAAVAGTHGKTSTTSMLASILIEAGKDPNVHLGGVVSLFNSNVRTGSSGIFITEACEYHENFLHITPEIGIVLNIEAEHLDYFGTLENVCAAFKKFIAGISSDGILIVCADSELAMECAKSAECGVATYSTFSADAPSGFVNAKGNPPLHHYYAADMDIVHGDTDKNSFSITDGYTFSACEDGDVLFKMTLHVPGSHNVSNALAAIAAARYLDCSSVGISEGLRKFTGAGRRFDVAGTYNGAFIINDYAHHPTEVKATVSAARTNCKGSLWAVFQPHTYSRAFRFQNEFCDALKTCEHVIVTDIYAAREPFTDIISAEALCSLFIKNGIDAVYISSFEEIAAYIKSHVNPDDAVLLLGAGTVNQISSMILT